MEKLDGFFIIYALLIYGFIVFSRKNRDTYKALLLVILLGNIINLDYITINFSTQFIQIFLLEIIIVGLSFIVIKFLEAFSNLQAKFMLFILELLGSFGLCYIFFVIQELLSKLFGLI